MIYAIYWTPPSNMRSEERIVLSDAGACLEMAEMFINAGRKIRITSESPLDLEELRTIASIPQ